MFGQIITLVSLIACIGLNVPFNVEKTIKYDEVVTTESFKQRNYQHSNWLNNYTEVIYRYDTNDVNSIDDLVVGNIYQLNMQLIGSTEITNILSDFVVGWRFGDTIHVTFDLPNLTTDNYLKLNYYARAQYGNIYTFKDGVQVQAYNIENKTTYFVYRGLEDYTDTNIINYISSTDFNIIDSVIYHQPTTIVGVINEFCETYLFSEIPLVSSMTFEIGGQSVNLMTWLVMLVGIALSIGLLILLFVVFKWLFLLFAGIFKR